MEKLTKQEEEIMLHIWRLGSCTTKEVLQQLEEPKPPYTTVASVMNNLKRKGYIKSKQQRAVYHFTPKIAQAEYKSDFMTYHNYNKKLCVLQVYLLHKLPKHYNNAKQEKL